VEDLEVVEVEDLVEVVEEDFVVAEVEETGVDEVDSEGVEAVVVEVEVASTRKPSQRTWELYRTSEERRNRSMMIVTEGLLVSD